MPPKKKKGKGKKKKKKDGNAFNQIDENYVYIIWNHDKFLFFDLNREDRTHSWRQV